MKTIKYMINSYLSDSVVTSNIEVSKTKFNKTFDETMKRYEAQEDKDGEFYVDMTNYYHEYPTYTEKRVSFSYSICAIDFVILECKEGYHFKQ